MPKSGFDLRQKVFYAEFRFIWNWDCPLLCRGPAPSSTKGKHIKGTQLRCTQFNFLPHPHAATMSTITFPTWLELSRTSTRLVFSLQSVSQSSSILSTRFASTSTIPPLIVSSSTMGSLKRCCVVSHSSSICRNQAIVAGRSHDSWSDLNNDSTWDCGHGTRVFFFSFSSLTPSTYLL